MKVFSMFMSILFLSVGMIVLFGARGLLALGLFLLAGTCASAAADE